MKKQRRRRVEKEQAKKAQQQAKVDPKALNCGLLIGVRNDGTPVVEIVGNMDLFQMSGAIEFAKLWFEDIWIDRIDAIKEKLRKETEEAVANQKQQQEKPKNKKNAAQEEEAQDDQEQEEEEDSKEEDSEEE